MLKARVEEKWKMEKRREKIKDLAPKSASNMAQREPKT